MHLTGRKIGSSEGSAVGGCKFDTDRRSVPYLRIGIMQRQ
jgi:hypothetical protein